MDLLLPPEVIVLCILGGLLLLLGALYLAKKVLVARGDGSTLFEESLEVGSLGSEDDLSSTPVPLGSVAEDQLVPPTTVQLFSQADQGRSSPVIEITPATDPHFKELALSTPLEIGVPPSRTHSQNSRASTGKKEPGKPQQTTGKLQQTTGKPQQTTGKLQQTTGKPQQTTSKQTTAKQTTTTASSKQTTTTTTKTSKSGSEKKVSSKPPTGKRDIGQKVAVRNIVKVGPTSQKSPPAKR